MGGMGEGEEERRGTLGRREAEVEVVTWLPWLGWELLVTLGPREGWGSEPGVRKRLESY